MGRYREEHKWFFTDKNLAELEEAYIYFSNQFPNREYTKKFSGFLKQKLSDMKHEAQTRTKIRVFTGGDSGT